MAETESDAAAPSEQEPGGEPASFDPSGQPVDSVVLAGEAEADSRWYVVLIEDGKLPVTHTFVDHADVKKLLMQHTKSEANAFVFFGKRVLFSDGEHKFLMLPDEAGTALPLFSLGEGVPLPSFSAAAMPHLKMREDGLLGPDVALVNAEDIAGKPEEWPSDLLSVIPMQGALEAVSDEDTGNEETGNDDVDASEDGGEDEGS